MCLLNPNSLFFESYHDGLVHTLKQMMTFDGKVYIVAPSRGQSLERFIDKAKL